MLHVAFEAPRQIGDAVEKAQSFHEGDIPLDRSKLHLIGLGGSAIAGELLKDMTAPQRGISIHRGTRPPRDKAGVIVSSYSGNTREILELSDLVTGGLRSVVYIASGGMLERLAWDRGIQLWKMPAGYQPRAAVGWSLALVATIAERWQVRQGIVEKLVAASKRLEESLAASSPEEQPLVRCALPIAQALRKNVTVIFHSLRCTGAARRLAAQINENGKQPAFALVMPEAMHNGVEGLVGGGDPDRWSLLFMFDQEDSASLRETMQRARTFFSGKGFHALDFPSTGEDAFDRTLSRLFIADMVSLLLAAEIGVDPTPIPAIREMKRLEPPLSEQEFQRSEAEIR